MGLTGNPKSFFIRPEDWLIFEQINIIVEALLTGSNQSPTEDFFVRQKDAGTVSVIFRTSPRLGSEVC